MTGDHCVTYYEDAWPFSVRCTCGWGTAGFTRQHAEAEARFHKGEHRTTGEAAGRRLSPELLAAIRAAVDELSPDGTGFIVPALRGLIGHIDAVEADLAAFRAGQPRLGERT